MSATSLAAVEYVRCGWHLTAYAPRTKGPRDPGWNRPENSIRRVERAAVQHGNIGLLHAWSRTAALDLDAIDKASAYFQSHGMDLDALWNAPNAVRIGRGHPNKGKILFTLPKGVDPLPTKMLSEYGFELRCGTANGLSTQDVLPPSIHDSGAHYAWLGPGDWRFTPELPPTLLAHWQSLLSPRSSANASDIAEPIGLSATQMRNTLARLDPTTLHYDKWFLVCACTHHESNGSLIGFQIFDEWSAAQGRFPSKYGTEEYNYERWTSCSSDKTGCATWRTVEWMARQSDASNQWSEMRNEQHVTTAAPALDEELAGDSNESAVKSDNYSDLGNSHRLARRFGDRLRHTQGGFMVHKKSQWIRDQSKVETQRLAMRTAKALYGEIERANDKAAALKHATRSSSRAAIDNMIHLVRSEEGISADLNDFDTQPMLLNVANGTIDLAHGTLRAHRREDMISKIAPVHYDSAARCPLWHSFMQRIFQGDDALIGYLQRVVGYFITGSTIEQVVFFAEGGGANGKTVFVETIQAMLGDYAQVAQIDLVMAKRFQGIPNDVARLHRARLVCLNETSQDAHFDEAKLKDLSGGDKLTGRFLHQEFFDFTPTHKLFIRGNHRPKIRGRDDGIWRRLHLIPFQVRIPPGERDPNLAVKLRGELPGILNWAIRGCLDWQRSGLSPPSAVVEAVKAYRCQSDTVLRFVTERCVIDASAREASSGLIARYVEFCQSIGELPENSTVFKAQLEGNGFRYERTNSARVYKGLRYQWDSDRDGL